MRCEDSPSPRSFAKRNLARWVAAGAAVVATLVGACAIYDSSLLVDADAGDAGPEAAPQPDAAADVDTCSHASWPARPAADADGGVAEAGDLLFAIDTAAFAPDAGAPPLGYDLDHTCTCTTGGPSCVPPQGKRACDDDAGRDNAGAQLVADMASYLGLDTQTLTAHLRQGLFGFLIRVSGYNRTPNDANVVVSVYASNGTVRDDAGAPIPPGFDGGDLWTVDPNSSTGPPDYTAPFGSIDQRAYVANNVLVASLNAVNLSLAAGAGTGSLMIHLSSAIITAHLEPDGSGGYRLTDGVLAGRWPTSTLLPALAPFPFGGGYLCGDSGVYVVLKADICTYRDIMSSSAYDNTGAECDAISIAVGFQAGPAQFGGELGGTTLQPCGTSWSDSCQ